MRILYVEDDVRDAGLVLRELQKSAPGFAVDVVNTLHEAQAQIGRPHEPGYDLILTDYRLPDGDGLALLTHVRGQALPCAVVLITGQGDEEVAVAALMAGADDYIAKHKDYLARLPLTLETALQRHRADAARRARPLRVLYAEHSATDIDLTRRHLARYAPHIHLDVVNTGPEVLQRCQTGFSGAYDLLLLDYSLPGLNALAVLKELRQGRGLDMPIVLVTGHGDEEVATQALKLGASDYVVKNAGYLFQLPGALENAFHRVALDREQAALRASEASFRLLFASNPLPMWVYDLQTLAFLEVNDAAIAQYGYARAEFLRMGLADIRPPEDVARLLEKVKTARPDLQFSGAWRHRRKNGVIFDVEIVSHTLEFAGRKAALVVAHDITERKRAAEALQESERKLKEAQTLGRIGNWEYDFQRQTLAWSDQVYVLYGRDPALGPPSPDEEAAYYSPQQAQTLREYAQCAIAEGASFDYDLEAHLPDGRTAFFTGSMRPVKDRDGRVIRLFGTVQDITERKRVEQAEREQRVLAEALRDTAAALASTLSFDEVLDRILVEVGRVAPHDAARIMLVEDGVANTVRACGYEGREPEGAAQPLCLPIAAAVNLAMVTQTGQPLAVSDTHDFAGWVDWPQTRWVRSNATAPIKIKERVIGFLGLESATPGFFAQTHAERLQAFADQAAVAIENARLYDEIRRYAAELEGRVAARTAELTQREMALRAANEELERLSQVKSEFVSNVSHELRTPLTNIKGYLQLLERGKPEKRGQYMATLNREAELLHRLIEDLLHLSRLDLGKVRLALAPVDVNQMVTLLVNDRAVLFADRGLTLEARITPDLPLIQADEKMLIQVLTNLMTNAMNYTPAGGQVTVKTGLQIADFGLQIDHPQSEIPLRETQAVRNPQWVTFSVTDTGPGISIEDQARLFERFYRGEAARQTGAPGTGLGLAICQELVQRHGGWMTVGSQLGQGSTFTVWLPMKQE